MKTKMFDIWKLQRPIFTNGSMTEVMAYTYNKENVKIIDMNEADMDVLFGDELKVYVAAEVRGKNLYIEDYVEGQDW